ncbi:MAG: 4-(cytidine 5'-diphospho)-2-C-methyl-D-erythritol kinase [Clostridia bacterium]|nr:4-(cytidine 5'-diphospho)-2-C-methyl-D-erythritol kinase [Clostridia bacterium]
MEITRKAYGKINLALEIHERRPDGYHDLSTVMQSVGLYDLVTVSNECEKGIHITCDLPYIPLDERNIVWKAAVLFYEKLGKADYGVKIDLKKRIPVGGGMAGGSTNCASVLMSLNEIEGNPFSKDELYKIGAALGADVPFTMMGGAAIATGIGTELVPVTPLKDCHIVLCKPKFSISTKCAFSSLDPATFTNDNRCGQMVEYLKEGNVEAVAHNLYNSFEAPIIKLKPEIQKIKHRLYECGAIGALMTGSGSTVYGIFNNCKKAEAAVACIGKCMAETYKVTPKDFTENLPKFI